MIDMKMRNTTLAAIILAAGMLLALASVFYFFMGYPMIHEALESDSSGAEVAKLLKMVWVFSTITMALCGIWAMFIGISIRKNLRYTKKQALSLGSGIAFFGLYGFVNPFPNFKLGLFLFIGLLILIPAFFLSKKQGPYH